MNVSENAIAIVGMDLNLPGCQYPEEYWNVLLHSVECIEDVRTNSSSDMKQQENYVNRMSVCKDYDKFDASFFGYSKHEAKVMDPQHRLFLQSCWKVIEHAGYRVSELDGKVGVFGSAGYNTYLINALLNEENYLEKKGYYDVLVGNDKDYMATRVSYKLGLKGPSMTVQTACSSSLVGVHLACQSLLMGEADFCLAGGACVRVPCEEGYTHQTGFIMSEDGHCRPFDQKGTGTVFGSGVGVVALKRLEDAIEANDTIYAVIRTTAINNDGNRKIGYTAPSYEGQTNVTQEALSLEDIEPESIRFIEGHGTGTKLGDPIELNSIMNTFGLSSEEKNRKYPCAIGSVKSNIGHLDTAAGIAGLIKACLCIYHKKIVPTLHFEDLNHKVSFDNTRFYIADKLEDMKQGEYPLRAVVSAFGVGGTNVSVILEEAPCTEEVKEEQNVYLIALSAKTVTSLKDLMNEVRKWDIRENAGPFAYTLDTGREQFEYRSYYILNKDSENLEYKIYKQSEIAKSLKKQKVVLEFSDQKVQIPLEETLYYENEIFKKYMDKWLICLTEKCGMSSDFKQAIAATDEQDRQMFHLVLKITMAETLYYYCEDLMFASQSLRKYLNGEMSQESFFDAHLNNSLFQKDSTINEETLLIDEISTIALYEVLGNVWLHGYEIKWEALFKKSEKKHIAAPTYEFEKTRYWYQEKVNLIWKEKKKKLGIPTGIYKGDYIVFGNPSNQFWEIINKMWNTNLNVVKDSKLLSLEGCYLDDYLKELIETNSLMSKKQIRVVFIQNVEQINKIQEEFYKYIKIIQWMNNRLSDCRELSVILLQVRGHDNEINARSMIFEGIVNTIPKELLNVKAKQVICNTITDKVIDELYYNDYESKVWIEEQERYGVVYERDSDNLKKNLLKDDGTYVITGGTGNVGLLFAQEIAKRVKANIILVSKNFNKKEIFSSKDEKQIIMQNVIKELHLNQNNVEIVQVDIGNIEKWKEQLYSLKKKYGKIDGIVHGAGKVGKAYDFVNVITPEIIDNYMDVKVNGAFVIDQYCKKEQLDFCIYTSSTVSILGGIGDVTYSGANAVLNELPKEENGTNNVCFSVILDYMPRIYKDEYVSENDSKVKNLLADQLSKDNFSSACDTIFSNVGGENLIISKTDFQQRYIKEKEIRMYSAMSVKESVEENKYSKQNIKSRVKLIWNRILESECEETQNFFDAGGDSFLAIKLTAELNQEFSLKLPVQYVYEFSTIKLMVHDLFEKFDQTDKNMIDKNIMISNQKKNNVYVVGLAGRFPDADNVDELWWNLMSKRQSIAHFSEDEEANALNAEADGKINKYVGARAVISDVDKFDYQFFGISKLEAELMDPQQRIFIETVWNALEDAGCINVLEEKKVGVFASQGISTYLINILLKNDKIKEDYNNVAVVNNSPDALATRISYLLNLTGISKTIQTFCSSSLVAMEEAISSIESGKCDLAVVGGVNIVVPQHTGYIYNESAIYSPTGEVRPFDDKADGTVFGNGVGVVVLASESFAKEKKLHSYAQVVGVGINNDGSQKAGFLSPSIKGQSECIREAFQKADITPFDVSYVEAHGTATNVGDPIEVHALEHVFERGKEQQAYCALGSIKGNIGHLDRAAGITSFIKGCLVAEKHCIPPAAGFEKVNKYIDLKDSPFYINQVPVLLEKEKDIYVGVSALGVGGTNVHVLIKSTKNEESREKKHTKFIIPFSAKCEESLIEQKQRFYEFLKQENVDLNQLAYVMQTQRRCYDERYVLTAVSQSELLMQLEKKLTMKKDKKINTILCTYSITNASLAELVKRLVSEETWLKSYVEDKFGSCAELFSKQEFVVQSKEVFEHCFKECLRELLHEKVILMFKEEGHVLNISSDERTINIRVSEDMKNQETGFVLTPDSVLDFSNVIALLWQSGIGIEWEKYNADNVQETIHLPGYAFRKTKCWIKE